MYFGPNVEMTAGISEQHLHAGATEPGSGNVSVAPLELVFYCHPCLKLSLAYPNGVASSINASPGVKVCSCPLHLGVDEVSSESKEAECAVSVSETVDR